MSGAALAIAHARSMIGVPWRHQGRKPWAVDCLGLVILSLRAGGWSRTVDAPARYGREPWDDRLRRGLRVHFGEPVTGTCEPCDVALARWGAGEPTHVGLLADYVHGGLSIIHASTRQGVIETALAGRIRDAVIEAYRPNWGDA
ncbi:C40 family peptidase [Lysobacter auxotrophicus]|uniref:NlpC/P60 family protein n=1 Tax=Lysobacter auxotrophicus TaxID=2992573 RepID=A0ABM8DFZ6_9GAMM|nr:hypothetical protein [Lysobacter auxotrophicus]BDU17517.1 NlpC/P60 family protein [Lysobacter auxotrophicus]